MFHYVLNEFWDIDFELFLYGIESIFCQLKDNYRILNPQQNENSYYTYR